MNFKDRLALSSNVLKAAILEAGKKPPSADELDALSKSIAKEILFIEARYAITRIILFVGAAALVAALFGLSPFRVIGAALLIRYMFFVGVPGLKTVEEATKLKFVTRRIDDLVESLPRDPNPSSGANIAELLRDAIAEVRKNRPPEA